MGNANPKVLMEQPEGTKDPKTLAFDEGSAKALESRGWKRKGKQSDKDAIGGAQEIARDVNNETPVKGR